MLELSLSLSLSLLSLFLSAIFPVKPTGSPVKSAAACYPALMEPNRRKSCVISTFDNVCRPLQSGSNKTMSVRAHAQDPYRH